MRRFFSALLLLSTTPLLLHCTTPVPTPTGEGEDSGDNPHVTDPDATTGGNTPGSSTGANGSGGSSTNPDDDVDYQTVCTKVCSDEPPPDQAPTCAEWKEWGTCGQEWFSDYCKESCGTCTGGEEVCTQVPINPGSGGSSGGTDPGATVDPLPDGAQNGWASRYWDCCKPHCAWPGNSPGGAMNMCTISDAPLSDEDAESSCNGGSAYTCWSMAPWAVSSTLAYGYAATPAGGNDCGKCYQLEFTGEGQHNPDDPGSGSLSGKTMIVQSTNVGGDVGSGQFDLLIPGGGVGAFNGCSQQWGTDDLGAQYGGFLTACNDDVNCLKNKCQEVFSGKGELLAGCLFHAEWMGGANNPKLRYAEVDCPPELEAVSGMSL